MGFIVLGGTSDPAVMVSIEAANLVTSPQLCHFRLFLYFYSYRTFCIQRPPKPFAIHHTSLYLMNYIVFDHSFQRRWILLELQGNIAVKFSWHGLGLCHMFYQQSKIQLYPSLYIIVFCSKFKTSSIIINNYGRPKSLLGTFHISYYLLLNKCWRFSTISNDGLAFGKPPFFAHLG